MLRWTNAVRLSQTCTIWLEIVSAMATFRECGDVSLSDTTSENRLEYVRLWRDSVPGSISRAFSSCVGTGSGGMLASEGGAELEAALLIHREGLRPVWRVVVVSFYPSANREECAFFIFTLDLKDVMTFLRCPPGYRDALRSERQRLDWMREQQKLNPHRWTAEDFENAHMKVRPDGRFLFRTYPHKSHRLRFTDARLEFRSLLPGARPSSPVTHSTLLAILENRENVSVKVFDSTSDIAKDVSLAVTCATERVPVGVRPNSFFYSQNLEFELRWSKYHGIQWGDFIFDRKAREAAGFSTKNTTGRYEHIAKEKRRPRITNTHAEMMHSSSDEGEDMATPEKASPFTRKVQRLVGEARVRAQLADEACGSDAEIDHARDLLPAHRSKKRTQSAAESSSSFSRSLYDADSD
tara:strand:+ start:430 stop:1659 length:1230 start_codon:yes stop_codon:yes gene_type:complete